MIVGFTIIDFKGHEDAAIRYIEKVCILEDSKIAENIVKAGVGVNVYSNAIELSELRSQPFDSIPIETQEGRHIVASIVNFNLELLFNGKIIRLVPTEYMYIPSKEVAQFKTYVKQGIVKLIPDVFSGVTTWVLENGKWEDSGIWIDNEIWRDN